jgi:hypothetical protein
MNGANSARADTDWMTLPVVSDALLCIILGLEGVQAAPRLLDDGFDILCALALRRWQHDGATVGVCSCCGCCEGVWYASGWKIAKRYAVVVVSREGWC